jgi:hypothetical protein
MSFNIPIGNWTPYVQKEINNKENASFIVGKSGGGTTEPAIGCKKRFTSTYQCGSGPNKVVNIEPEAWGQAALFDCTAESKQCSGFKLTLGDDGNMVITNNNNSQIWSSNTNKTGLVQSNYSAKKGKNGRNYLMSEESLNIGEFIGSPSGNCYLIMEKDLGLQLKYNISSCLMVDNNTGFGTDDNTFATYSLEKTNITNLGKVGYISQNGKIHEYPDSMISLGTDFSLIGSYDSVGNDIKQLSNTTLDKCKQSCNELDNCHGFVYGTSKKIVGGVQFVKVYYPGGRAECIQISQLAVYSNGDNVAKGKPVSAANMYQDNREFNPETANDGVLSSRVSDIYHSNCLANDYWLLDLQQEYPIEKVVYYNRGNSYASRAKGMLIDLMDSNKKVLKSLTLTGDMVQTFDISLGQQSSADTCWLKNSEMFPKGLRQENSNYELYARNKSVKNNASCNKSVEASNSMTWDLFPTGDKMSMDMLCNLGLVTEQERKDLDNKNANLKDVAKIIEKKVNNLSQKQSDLSTNMNLNIDKLQSNINSYADTQYEKKDYTEKSSNIVNVNAMLEDTDLNMISQNYKNLIWTILAIILIIGGIRLTRSITTN